MEVDIKDKILQLRAEGKSYNEIKEILGCSKGTISYHCGLGQKEKNANRTKNRRKKTVICQKVERFQYRKLRIKADDFQRERLGYKNRLGKRLITFNWRDVINKFGWETTCHLTGRPINLKESKSYQFDHIIPYSKGGSSTIENLGIACKEANQAKSNMVMEEFIELCKQVLQHSGYEVNLRSDGRVD